MARKDTAQQTATTLTAAEQRAVERVTGKKAKTPKKRKASSESKPVARKVLIVG